MALAGRLGEAGAACVSSLSSVAGAGCDHFVAKPCLPDELLVRVRALLDAR